MPDTFQEITEFLYEEKTKELEQYPLGEEMIVGFARDNGGALTFLKDRAEPQRGYPAGDYVHNACVVKKVLIFLILKRNPILILSIKAWSEIITDLLHFAFKDFFLPYEKLSQPVKEIYRNIKGKKRDLVCLIFEFDMRYRYVLQDAISNSFIKTFNTLIKREKYPQMKRKWRIIKWIIILSPKIRKEVRTFFKNIDTRQFAFSREDLYWTSQFYKDYLFRGKTREQRTKEMEKIYGKSQIEKDEEYIKENKVI